MKGHAPIPRKHYIYYSTILKVLIPMRLTTALWRHCYIFRPWQYIVDIEVTTISLWDW